MRILMLSWEYPPRIVGGISRVVSHLAQELGAAGHQVTVLTMSDENLAPFEQDGTVSVVRVPSWYVRPITFVDSVMQMNMAMVTAAVRMIQSGSRFDVLHMHDWLVAFAGKTLLDLYPDLVGLCTIHATEFGRNNGIHNDIQSYISGVEQKRAGELSSRVIVNSRYMREEVIRLFDMAADTLDIIPNGIDPHMFDPVPVDMSLRRCHAADNDRVVFFVGRLTYEKGVHLLMDAIPRVLARYQDVKFIIAGKGQELDALRQRAWNMGVAHRVDFPDFYRRRICSRCSGSWMWRCFQACTNRLHCGARRHGGGAAGGGVRCGRAQRDRGGSRQRHEISHREPGLAGGCHCDPAARRRSARAHHGDRAPDDHGEISLEAYRRTDGENL
jgi:glycosyltransferase involved in cell wall biosynthesis